MIYDRFSNEYNIYYGLNVVEFNIIRNNNGTKSILFNFKCS